MNIPVLIADLERQAPAEIRVARRALEARTDPGRPLRSFADPGFRLDARGPGWRHGGRAPWGG